MILSSSSLSYLHYKTEIYKITANSNKPLQMLFPQGEICSQIEVGWAKSSSLAARSLTQKSSLTFCRTISCRPQAVQIYTAMVFGCVWICLDQSSLGWDHITAGFYQFPVCTETKFSFIFFQYEAKGCQILNVHTNTNKKTQFNQPDKGPANVQKTLCYMRFIPS